MEDLQYREVEWEDNMDGQLHLEIGVHIEERNHDPVSEIRAVMEMVTEDIQAVMLDTRALVLYIGALMDNFKGTYTALMP